MNSAPISRVSAAVNPMEPAPEIATILRGNREPNSASNTALTNGMATTATAVGTYQPLNSLAASTSNPAWLLWSRSTSANPTETSAAAIARINRNIT